MYIHNLLIWFEPLLLPPFSSTLYGNTAYDLRVGNLRDAFREGICRVNRKVAVYVPVLK
jgi:hypothetical protein